MTILLNQSTTQATSASDVLAVMLLQKQFGMTAGNKNMMRVVPLFETLNDLTNAADVVELLFSLPGNTTHIHYYPLTLIPSYI